MSIKNALDNSEMNFSITRKISGNALLKEDNFINIRINIIVQETCFLINLIH